MSREPARRAPGLAQRCVRTDARAALLIGLLCLLVYNANGRAISAGDAYPARYLPFAIWHHHTVLLDPIADLAAQGRAGTAHWMVRAPSGHLVSLYPVIQPVLLAPLYLPAVAWVHLQGWTDDRVDLAARVMEKLAASLVAALSAVLLYLLLRRRAPRRVALWLTLAYAFGTTTWVVSSQALWQHGMAELLLVGLLLLLTAPSSTPRALLAGLLCGLVACNRPPDLLIASALGVYGLGWAGRRRAGWFAAAAALPMLLTLAFNLAVTGNVAGGYGLAGTAAFFQHDPLAGLAGLLLSPTRGLLVFSPFLLFLLLAGKHPPATDDERRLSLAAGAAVGMQLVLYALTDWRTGVSWGPRYLTDLVPLLVWLLAPVVAGLGRRGRAGFLAATVAAITVEAIGAWCYTGATDAALFADEGGARPLRAAWEVRNAGFVAAPRQGLAPAELGLRIQGSLDALEVDGVPRSRVVAGDDLVAAGWALADGAPPWQVAAGIDGKGFVSTREHVDRPDVRRALGIDAPAGWRIRLPTRGLTPGEHTLSVLLWAAARGATYHLTTRAFTVVVPDLGAAARAAAARLRAHQGAPGYWLTAYTATPHFAAPRAEMNTFVTALLVDLLAPLEPGGGFGGTLERARAHLRGQIEASGLVRYHGRPDAPGIGSLGCVITPDADDTALAWRIAPIADAGAQARALRTLARDRRPDGLYRTWLAPREAYQCLDPGRDPNPADLTIQMHLLLWLARADPPAGRALCAAVRPRVDDDGVWVYYHETPLVPLLRLDDLAGAGCALALPPGRGEARVPGQAPWIDAARLLRAAPASADPRARRAAAEALAARIAADDFALVRASPPLLYHNDLTAGTPRYYWSEDVGYALFLRLVAQRPEATAPVPGVG